MSNYEYNREWRRLNPEKHKASKKRWQAKNRQRHNIKQRERAARRREKRRAIIDALKAKPCMDCGGTFPPYCMDFDHRDQSTKVDIVGKCDTFPGGFDALLAEVEKCDLVCACCHRIRTFTRDQHKGRAGRSTAHATQLPLLEEG